MKTLLLTLCLSMCSVCLFAQNNQVVKPKVDERMELLSTVFRLAGASEYVANDLKQYTEQVDNYFSPHRNHPIIAYAQEIRKNHGIGYDAVMSFAQQIEIDGTISFIENRVDGSLESRWTDESADTFLKLLNDFYKESRFHDFFVSNKGLYEKAENNFSLILNAIDFSWFENFYGVKRPESYKLVISMLNGGSNYGGTVNKKDGSGNIYAVIGSWSTDSVGTPVYSPRITSIIIHEYNHSYCNPLIAKYYDDMADNAETAFSLVKGVMQRQAYGNSQTMLCETLVRASEIMYQLKDSNNVTLKNRLCTAEIAKGFLWTGQIVDLLYEYKNERSTYPTLDDFMPQIVSLFNSLDMAKMKEEADMLAPKILGTNIADNATDVDPNLTEIIVKFDKPMYTKANGASYGRKGEGYMPEVVSARWNEDTKQEWIIEVKLKPDTEYSLS
ncbi:hypothetical protein M2132_002502, partial [Dysgonomonas sp. PH5-45]|uniref:DUF4932 domain-containing protein n=1 Tax=unclassified Dysgonomonas TaxID=2630389 RepID=UPI00247314FF